MPVALAVVLGVACDRWCSVSLLGWLAGAAFPLIVAAAALAARRTRTATLCLLIAVAALAAARHHRAWSIRGPDDVARRAGDEPRLVQLTGTVAGAPWVQPRLDPGRSAWPDFEKTLFELDVAELGTGDGAAAVSGRVRVSIVGHLPHLEAGDRIAFRGWFARPRPPDNPGEFDFAAWLRARQVHATAWASHPDAVRLVETGSEWNAIRIAARIRTAVERSIERHLSNETAPIAATLLVGSRSRVPDETRVAFAQTGTLHLLAISGLHVGILAAFVWFPCRLCGLRAGTAALVLLFVLGWYAVLVGGRASVLRATVFVAVAVLGRPWHRSASPFQILALSAVALLAWRPCDLFDTGAQLSFLAVAAIALVVEWQRARPEREPSIGGLVERGPLARLAARGARAVAASWIVMAAIWLFTTPLVAHVFHLVSPAGILLNVLLVPAVAVVMWCGYAFVVLGTLSEPLAALLAGPFDLGLEALLAVTRVAGRWSLGHLYVAGPAAWWVGGFHLVLLVLLFNARRPRWAACVAAAVLGWFVVGAVVPGETAARGGELRCTFLSVGHGNAVFLELPNGRTLLYDGGSLADPIRADRVIRSAVWGSGRSRIDAVVVSHADVDHFNALPDVLRAVRASTVCLSRPLLDFAQPQVVLLCEAAAGTGSRIELLKAGDALPLDPDVSIRVLHPAEAAHYATDNEASLVLLVEYAGRRLLLTGDVELRGLDDLVAGPPVDVDVLAAPHHGSPAANTPALAEWCRPEHVVVSAGPRTRTEPLRATYAPAEVHVTEDHGAVEIVVRANGQLTCRPWRVTASPE